MRHLVAPGRPLTALLSVLPVVLLTALLGGFTLASERTDRLPSTTESTSPLCTRTDVAAVEALDIVPLQTSPSWIVFGRVFGASVAGAGDINGDGYGDVIIGDWRHQDDQSQLEEGAAYVYLGSSSGLPPIPSWFVEGDHYLYRLGFAVAGAGDVNRDGYSDVLIGVPGYVSDPPGTSQRVVLYLGSPSGLASVPDWTYDNPDSHGLFGKAIASAGDVNFDGYSDVILGDAGRAQVYLGSATGLSHSADWTVEGIFSTEFLGSSVAAAGDVNGDCFGDVIIAAPWRSDSGRPPTVSVYLGSASGPSMTPVWTQTEPTPPPGYGLAVSTAGDLNGDGYDDILVGIPYLGGGFVHVHLGSPSGPSVTPDWILNDSGSVALSLFGNSVASAGDVNCDGYDDVIIGAPQYWRPFSYPSGRSVVYLGSPSGLSAAPQWIAYGQTQDGLAGWSVASAGDVDGSGAVDVLVGAPGPSQGIAYAYLAVTQGCVPSSPRCVAPPPPPGACCVNSGTCSEGTQTNCVTGGGTYQGDGSTCGTVTCTVVPQPCDFDDLVAKVVSLDTTDQVKNGLMRKLDEAKKALDRGNITVAINKLHDFRDQVAGRAGNAISQADADALDACASEVMERLQAELDAGAHVRTWRVQPVPNR